MTQLAGRRVLVTRPGGARDPLVEGLRSLGAEVVRVPVMTRRRLAPPAAVARGLRDHASAGVVIVFTSAHAARLVAEAGSAAGEPLGEVAATVVAIGPGTAAALAAAGRRADLVPDTYVAEAVADQLVARGVDGRTVWLPRAAEGRSVLPERLRAAGAAVTELALYRTAAAVGRADELATALAGRLDGVTFTSGSTVRHFDTLRRGRPLPAGCLVACIGPVTAEVARAAGHPPAIIAAEHTVKGLLAALRAGLGAGDPASRVAPGGPP